MVKVISVNAGSSSLKFQLFEMPSEKTLCSGIVERIGFTDAISTIKFNGNKVSVVLPIKDHKIAVELVLKSLIDNKIVLSLDELTEVGHRFVHGGEAYAASIELNDDVEKTVESLIDLAPLHNPANLIGFRAFKKELPNARHVAVFDTAFHQTMKPEIYLYPIPYEYYTNYKIRRYGFHGTSHYYVSHRVAELMHKNPKDINVITCHLGNGASIAAVEGGISVNTSMGFTPLAGIMMGTRSGDIDPAMIPFLMNKLSLKAEEVVDILNKKSGMLGVSGISSDARDIEKRVNEGDPRALLTLNLYANRIAQTIGSYFVQLGHLDAIVFTGGVGENDANVRAAVAKRVSEALHIDFDYDLNSKSRSNEVLLSKESSHTQIWIVPTNEELVIARDTVRILGM